MPPEQCAMPYCQRTDTELYYYGKPVCSRCWTKWAKGSPNELKRKLKIREPKETPA